MYEEQFGLSGSPFKLSPDPKFFFGSRSHNKAMAYLHYGLKQAEGFIVITGPIGSGKTMVISQLLDQLNASNVIAAQLLTSNIEPEELLDHTLSAFRIEPETNGRTGKLEAFEDYLFDQLNKGRRVLLIVDEAQNLPFETLEELRMLSNIDYDGTPLFQVFLVGQPEFRDTLQTERLEQLRQRVIASYHLENLDADETGEYIVHRLSVAGWREDPSFDEAAIAEIYAETGGRPRRINTVCNRIMLYCAIEEEHVVTAEIAKTVIGELHEEELEARDVEPAASEDEARASEAMPPVRSVERDEEAEEELEAPLKRASGDDVVVSIETARTRGAASEEAAESDDRPAPADVNRKGEGAVIADEKEQTAEAQRSEPVRKEPAEDAPAPGASVFDRVRAQRPPRPEATLADVANAIAAASASDAKDYGYESDAVFDDDERALRAAAIPPLKSVQTKEWRRQVRSSIDDTRKELKEAHASVTRLRKSLKDMERRRAEKREKIVSGLARAETLVNELRESRA